MAVLLNMEPVHAVDLDTAKGTRGLCASSTVEDL
jgi:hypothetical protein